VTPYRPRAAVPPHVLEREDFRQACADHDFGAVFKLANEVGGVSYSAIAECAGIKPERVGQIAKGVGSITSFEKVAEIADGMRIPGDMLLLAPRPWEREATSGLTLVTGSGRGSSAPKAERSMGIGDAVRARRHGSALSAQRVFTNRDDQVAAFFELHERLSTLARRSPNVVLDLKAPRRNVLAFYGQGGIGKTRLSNELERRFRELELGKVRRGVVRIDFSEPSARDPELFLLALRAGFKRCLGAVPGVRHVLGFVLGATPSRSPDG
jgi:hypothetical protein